MEHYVTLLSRIQDKDAKMVGRILECVLELFRTAATRGPWRHFVQSARFFAASVAAGYLDKGGLEALVQSLMHHIGTSTDVVVGDFALWVLCAALPVAGANVVGEALPRIKTMLSEALGRRSALKKAIPRDLATVWMLFGEAISRPSPSPSSSHPEAHAMDLSVPELAVDGFWDGDFEALSLFPDAYAIEGGGECADFEKWSIIYGCRHLVESMELNHRRCAEQLLVGIPSRFSSPEKIVVQFLFGELLRNRVNGMTPLVYESLLIDACRLSRSFPPAMARGLGALYERLDELGFVATDRLAAWFAHHLSNFDYKWKWDNWTAVLSIPPTSMQYVFVRFALEKLLRLSYYDRIAPTLPDDFRTLLPTEPKPHYKYAEELGEAAEEDCELAAKLVALIQSRRPVEEIRAAISGDDASGSLDAHQREVLLESLLHVGSKSMSHMLAVVEKYLALFQLLVPKSAEGRGAGAARLLGSVGSFWRNSGLHLEFTVERLVNYRILLPGEVIEWIFSEASSLFSDPECSFYRLVAQTLPRSLLLRTIQQAAMMPAIARTKMRDQPEERVAAVVEGLRAEARQTLRLAVQKLACLKDELVTDDDQLGMAVERLCIDLVREITAVYPVEVASLAPDLLSSLGRRAPLPLLEILEQVAC